MLLFSHNSIFSHLNYWKFSYFLVLISPWLFHFHAFIFPHLGIRFHLKDKCFLFSRSFYTCSVKSKRIRTIVSHDRLLFTWSVQYCILIIHTIYFPSYTRFFFFPHVTFLTHLWSRSTLKYTRFSFRMSFCHVINFLHLYGFPHVAHMALFFYVITYDSHHHL